VHPHVLSHNLPFPPYLLPCGYKERERERERGVTGFQGVLLLLPFLAMVTLGHLQSLANQGFMVAMELTACRVLEDPAFPAPVKGDVVTFVAFY
jgi:hypothetical protein